MNKYKRIIFFFKLAEEIIDSTKRYTRKWNDVLKRRNLVDENWLKVKIFK